MPRVLPSSFAQRVLDNFSSGEEEGSDSPGRQAYEHLGDSVLQHYVDACTQLDDAFDKDTVFLNGVSRVKEHLASTSGGLDCLICLGRIRPQEAVWSCSGGCFAILHLVCIQDWAKNQQEAAGLRATSRLTPELFPAAASDAAAHAQWHCPKCRHPYDAKQVPKNYTCFCGKKDQPEWDPWLTPHSCGELCERKLPGSCSHTCTLLCHPGPCPPCPRVVDAACYCKKKTVRRRCGNFEYSCGGTCGRHLECGHTCDEVCHSGPCPPCPREAKFSCLCGAESHTLPCSERVYQCERVCGKSLACGRHVCEQVCHAGACKGCPNSGKRTCPCGKQAYDGLRCDDKVPTCVETCGKLLPCGRHHCQEKCHHGACTKVCRALVMKACRCGGTARSVQCHADVVCEKRCMAVKNCGRHPCKRRCCDGNCPPCEETCNRRLGCGHHKCPAPCHSGPCQPCPLSGSVTCACGQTRSTFICGGEAKVIPPRCRLVCPIPPTCRHASLRKSHRCHFGPCPPCMEPCGSVLPCGHMCSTAKCHDPMPPPVPSFITPKPPQHGSSRPPPPNPSPSPPSGPSWPIVQIAKQLQQQAQPPCPPCTQPVPVTCMGEHTTKQVACSEAKAFQCEQQCGRRLACGHHQCSKPCHAVMGKPQGEECEVCTLGCNQPRCCPHPCPLPCHPDPCSLCTITCRRPCLCGKATLSFPCHQNQLLNAKLDKSRASKKFQRRDVSNKLEKRDASNELDVSSLLSCGKPCHKLLAFCPHPCRAVCHVGQCPDPEGCGEEVTVRCSCKKNKQKWRCSQVQVVLMESGKSRAYDGSAALRMLPCNEACTAQGKASKGQEAASSLTSSSVGGTKAAAQNADSELRQRSRAGQETSDTEQADTLSRAMGGKRLSRSERDRIALQRQREREQLESKQRWMRWLKRGAMLLLCVLLSALLGKALSAALRSVDERAAAKWKA